MEAVRQDAPIATVPAKIDEHTRQGVSHAFGCSDATGASDVQVWEAGSGNSGGCSTRSHFPDGVLFTILTLTLPTLPFNLQIFFLHDQL